MISCGQTLRTQYYLSYLADMSLKNLNFLGRTESSGVSPNAIYFFAALFNAEGVA
jgi:hypothetical protein